MMIKSEEEVAKQGKLIGGNPRNFAGVGIKV